MNVVPSEVVEQCVYTEHKLQTAAYAQALNEEFEEQVTNRVILHIIKRLKEAEKK